MGGCVNVFLRDNQRNFYKMRRWTNSLPGFLNTIGDEANEDRHLRDYMRAWLVMKQDWEDNRCSGKFRENMTPVYFPSPTRICNSEYGLVFVDYVTKTVISYQDYTMHGDMTTANIVMRMSSEERNRLGEIADEGKIRYRPNGFSTEIFEVKDSNHMASLLQEDMKSGDLRVHFMVDNRPWTFEQGFKGEKPTKKLKEQIEAILQQ